MNDKKSTYFPGYNISNQKQEASKLEKLKTVYKKEGLASLIKKIYTYIIYKISYPIFKISYPIFKINYTIFNRFFILDGKKYHYFINIYNSVKTERVVEIPFAKESLLRNRGKNILEIGNVLSHYFSFNHGVVDKYEISPGVINIDIIDFSPEKKYDLIISVSTIEHIGFDEPHKDKGKPKKALLKIFDLLNSNGTAIITVPLGYNPEIDSILVNNEISFTKKYFLKRVSILNLWKETTMEEALKYKYGQKYPAANSVAFLILYKEQ